MSIRSSSCVRALGLFLLALSIASSASADTRTWVSAVGDDLNPCARTSPCATFAGAFNKTDAGGEIDALNPGSYGQIYITKALTIDGGAGGAGVVQTLGGGNGAVIINAGSNDVVTLRNLSLDGGGTGSHGVIVTGGRSALIENCSIFGFGIGITFEPVGSMTLTVTNTTVHHNSSDGVFVLSQGGAFYARLTATQMRITDNGTGIFLANNALVFVRDSIVAGNTGNGVVVSSGSSAPAQLDLEGTTSSHNGASGVVSSGASASVRISNCTIDHNVAVGLLPYLGGQILSYGNNKVSGNGAGDGSVTGTATVM